MYSRNDYFSLKKTRRFGEPSHKKSEYFKNSNVHLQCKYFENCMRFYLKKPVIIRPYEGYPFVDNLDKT